ncbi:hypothetical protein F7Q99_36760 [Streptomyces kaniharaensis]|uniref:Uncharacterized protein n=1 Tax=Streptomyces kaniharaensis TaxID=212423 RepID=A0A6N7L680_9ACTN|nr:hypothetical protein [Streptomyces kaniharaensis]MQS17593.1 hypothetical protein [Streptomyces kaniharaensis]
MATATTPDRLLADAERSLTAARIADKILSHHPALPVELIHACGTDGVGDTTPLLELVLVDGATRAVADWANAVGTDVIVTQGGLMSAEHRATAEIDGVTVWVTAYEPNDDGPED